MGVVECVSTKKYGIRVCTNNVNFKFLSVVFYTAINYLEEKSVSGNQSKYNDLPSI